MSSWQTPLSAYCIPGQGRGGRGPQKRLVSGELQSRGRGRTGVWCRQECGGIWCHNAWGVAPLLTWGVRLDKGLNDLHIFISTSVEWAGNGSCLVWALRVKCGSTFKTQTCLERGPCPKHGGVEDEAQEVPGPKRGSWEPPGKL